MIEMVAFSAEDVFREEIDLLWLTFIWKFVFVGTNVAEVFFLSPCFGTGRFLPLNFFLG